MIRVATTAFLGTLVATTSLAAAASGDREDHYITPEQWRAAVAVGGVPSEILYAMSLTESGTTFQRTRDYAPWPWVLNISGQGQFFPSRDAARKALAEEIEKRNVWVDVGMFQINLKYNGHLVEDPLTLLEPQVNLMAAAQVLAGCGKSYSTVNEKVGCYYSGQYDDDGKAYASRVRKLAERWGKPYEMVDDDRSPIDNGGSLAISFEPSIPPQTSTQYLAFLQTLERNASDDRQSDDDVAARTIVIEGR